MIKIDWKGSGVFALKRGQSSDLVVRAATAVITAALYEWATGRGRVRSKLADRFDPSAFGKYGFSNRTSNYRKRQRKAMGQPRPYFSPRTMNFAKVAVNIAKPNALAALRAIAQLSTQAHTVSLVNRPGGFIISGTNGKRTTRVKIGFPGARALNKMGAKGEVYRKEFRDLTRGGDLSNILIRADELFTEHLAAALQRIPPKRITTS